MALATATTAALVGAGGALAGGYLSSRGSERVAETQAQGMRDASAIIAQQVNQARKEIKDLQGPAERNLLTGAQSAMATLGQTYPEQLRLTQEGNLNAQNLLGQGMGQYQDALLGNALPTAPTPTQLDYQMPEFTLPEFQTAYSGLGGYYEPVITPEAYQETLYRDNTQQETPQIPYRGIPGYWNRPPFDFGGSFAVMPGDLGYGVMR